MKRFLLLFILLSLSQAFGVTLDEVLDSYDFSYNDENFELSNLNYNNSLEIQIDFNGSFGEYLFVLDFYNKDEFQFRYINDSYFSNNNQSIKLFVPLIYNWTDYDLHLEIYKDDFLMFRDDFEIVLDNITISNLTKGLMFFNESINDDLSLEYLNYDEIKIGNEIENFQFNFKSNLNDGLYNVEFYFIDKIFNQSINIKDNEFQVLFNCSKLFDLEKEGPYLIKKLFVYDNGILIDSILIDKYIGPYIFSDFLKPNLPDFLVEEINGSFYILNNGTLNVSNVSYKIVESNSFELIDEGNINLNISEGYLIDINLSSFYILVDFENNFFELNEKNNIFSWPILLNVEEEIKIEEKISKPKSSSSSGSSFNKNSKNPVLENISFEEVEIEFNESNKSNYSQNNLVVLNVSKKINLNNFSIIPEENQLEIVKESIKDDEGFFDFGFLFFIGSFLVSIFSIVFLLL